ncbi:hypothetical protein EIP86_002836 [Pleurotus ostreatoroseus]|nr:hypothetical protein EIP86_002836 [Pleurotus ostreatoroseus]
MSTKKRAASEEAEDTRLTQRVRGSATRARGSIENASSLLHITSTAPPCSSTDALLALLDFTSLTAHDEISTRFDNIAEAILHSFGLRIANPDGAGTMVYTDYEVIELEFYLYISSLHEDPFTHGSDEQRQSGRWYFHRAPRRSTNAVDAEPRAPTAAGGYRGGTRKGLDLTLGGLAASGRSSKFFSASSSSAESKDPPRGGALLRSLKRVSDGKVISGPSLLVDEILSVNKMPAIAELVTSKWNSDTNALLSTPREGVASMYFYPLPVKDEKDSGTSPTIYRSSRMGLDLSHAGIPLPSTSVSNTMEHPRTVFVSKPYRYFVHPHLLTSNGRGHTFHGVYQTVSQQSPGLSEASLLNSVVKITTLKLETAKKYLQEYNNAKKSGNLAAFVGAKGKGAGSSPVPLLRMLGTLERLRTNSVHPE